MRYSISCKKAVRDRIPEIMQSSGKECAVKELSDPDFLVELENKLEEEVVSTLKVKICKNL
jgi:predicted house-cleaning noncanonical NTP pyrophosphatase (MazG superfamily)